MFGSEILETAIGLIFIYLTISLLTTAITEGIARGLALRSGTLVDSIRLMLGEKRWDKQGGEEKPTGYWEDFYNHPLIKNLVKGEPGAMRIGKGRPSYIQSRTFALVTLDLLFPRKGGNAVYDEDEMEKILSELPPDLGKPLLLMFDQAQRDRDQFRAQVETWFNDQMDRVSGWYKRKTTLIAFVIGLFLALFVNADTISITNGLLRDAAVRDAIVARAASAVESAQAEPGAKLGGDIDELQKQLMETQVLGWKFDGKAGDMDIRIPPAPDDGPGWLLKLLGIIITGAAVSLGAPFWFDILARVMNLRGTGAPIPTGGSQPAQPPVQGAAMAPYAQAALPQARQPAQLRWYR